MMVDGRCVVCSERTLSKKKRCVNCEDKTFASDIKYGWKDIPVFIVITGYLLNVLAGGLFFIIMAVKINFFLGLMLMLWCAGSSVLIILALENKGYYKWVGW